MAVHRRVEEGVIEKRHPLLGFPIPAPGVVLVGLIEVGIGAQGGEEGGFVIGRAAHPAIGHAGPGGDRIACADEVISTGRRPEEFVRIPARPGVSRTGQRGLTRRVM